MSYISHIGCKLRTYEFLKIQLIQSILQVWSKTSHYGMNGRLQLHCRNGEVIVNTGLFIPSYGQLITFVDTK